MSQVANQHFWWHGGKAYLYPKNQSGFVQRQVSFALYEILSSLTYDLDWTMRTSTIVHFNFLIQYVQQISIFIMCSQLRQKHSLLLQTQKQLCRDAL